MSEDHYKVALYVLVNGGSVEKKSCYDEEGVDCWGWSFDDKEWIALGVHEDLPPIPDEMVSYIKSKYKIV